MKVYIGPYPPMLSSRLHRRYLYRKYGSKSYTMREKDYSWDDRAVEVIEDIIQYVYDKTINRYFLHKERKIKVKIHKYDTWNADCTLALVIAPLLQKVKEDKHGGPKVDNEDVPEHLRSTQDSEYSEEAEQQGSTDKFWFDRWDWILDEMIYAFEMTNKDWESDFHSGESDFNFVPVDDKDNEVPKDEAVFYRMDRGPNDTFEVDHEGIKKIQDRIDNGYRLFGKYYRSLWS